MRIPTALVHVGWFLFCVWTPAVLAQTPDSMQGTIQSGGVSLSLPVHFLDTTVAAHPTIRTIPMDFPIAFLDSAPAPNHPGVPSLSPLRVLFIGNSLTYYNEMPRIFSTMAAAGLHRRVVVGLASLPGGPPDMLWGSTDVQQVMHHLPWDVVVLQLRPQSTALADTLYLQRWGQTFVTAMQAQQARAVLWLEYRGPGDPLRGQGRNLAITATAVGAAVAPIPWVWEAVRRADTTVWQALYTNLDTANYDTHPSALGSYLISLVLYNVISGQSPIGLPPQADTLAIPARTAHLLQQAAAATVQRMHGVPFSPPFADPAAAKTWEYDATLVPLTDELVTHFIALRTDLRAFWTAHADLIEAANTHTLTQTVRLAGPEGDHDTFAFTVNDYPTLAAHTPALLALFTRDQVSPDQYFPTYLTIQKAMYVLFDNQALGLALPADPTSVVGKNVALVQAHLQDLGP